MGDLPSTLGILLSGLLDAEKRPAPSVAPSSEHAWLRQLGDTSAPERSDADNRVLVCLDATHRVAH